ncbi:MAG: FkbM family methyltransferase [Agriterribacter sp.]
MKPLPNIYADGQLSPSPKTAFAEDIATLAKLQFEPLCRQYSGCVQFDNHIALCRVLTRYKIYVDTRDMGIARHLMLDGFWEPWVTQCLASIVKPGDVCIDIGANYGYYSALLLDLVGNNGRVIAIEPNPSIVKLLRLTADINSPGFDIEEVALSYKKGKIKLTVPKNYFGDASILEGTDKRPHIDYKVPTVRLDDVLREKQINKVDIIKIDVAGAEPWVFEGMQQTILQNPGLQIIMEYSPWLYEKARGFTEYLFARFTIRCLKDEQQQDLEYSAIENLLNLRTRTDLYLKRKTDF